MEVLIVDDDEFALSVVDNTLSRMGYKVVAARDGCEALDILRKSEIRLVITDWDMPKMNGVDLCRAIRKQDLSGYVYVIMLTGREGAKQRMEGLCAGADDFLNKPLDPEELLVCLKTAERILSLETRDVALFALAKLSESRDPETGTHIERVQHYTRLIAQNLSTEIKTYYGVDEEYVRLLFQTSPLHDLGKVGIPDTVLLKPGKLTESEFAIMKTHTIVGSQTLDAALQRFPNARFLQIAREIAATHHEKFDGSGYPHGLAGEKIPLCGRIVAVADVYDALTSRRVYKEASTHEEARTEILRERGHHFDPEVVAAFIRAEPQIIAARQRLNENAEPAIEHISCPLPAATVNLGPSTCKILVAEDDPLLRNKLVELLAATGQPVLAAKDGREAMSLVEKHEPRVIVSDWEMPQMDGVELCRNLRARSGTEPVHFIMLTGHSEKSRLLDAYQAGIDDFVSKPFDLEELLARVRAGIRNAKLHDDLVRKATGSQALNAQLATLNSRLERLSVTDELTGLYNRRHAMRRLQEQWALAGRLGRPLSVAMIDVDYFKKINDTHGHDSGDAFLRQLSVILRDQTRATDTVCRVGGEEFLIIFPAQTMEEVGVCAERCRAAVEAHTFSTGSTALRATISIGVAARMRGMADISDLLKVADRVLYQAKNAGRNAVHFDEYKEQPAMADSQPAPKEKSVQAQPAPTPAPVNMDAMLKRCGGDAKFAAALMDRFQAQAGAEVAKIEKALAESDAATMQRLAHSLKSMAAYLSAETASVLAREIEELGRAKNSPMRRPWSAACAWRSIGRRRGLPRIRRPSRPRSSEPIARFAPRNKRK